MHKTCWLLYDNGIVMVAFRAVEVAPRRKIDRHR